MKPLHLIFPIVLFASLPAQALDLALVAGASGGTGQLIANALRAKGMPVRGLTRDPATAPKLEGVTWVAGDVTRPETLRAALTGVTVVVSAVGAREATGPNSFETVDWEGNRALIDAAAQAKVRQMLLVTAGSAGEGAWTDPRLARFGGSRTWKAKAEAHLRDSGLPYTIVAPGGLRDYPAGQQGVKLRARSEYVVGPVSRGDVAALVATCVDNTSCLGKTITVVNDPQAKPGIPAAALQALSTDTPQSIRAPAAVGQ